jgi:hypothetical protein
MSSRNWSSDVAIGGVAVATILICVAIANILSDRDRPSYRDYPEGYKQLAPSGTGVSHRRPPADRSICNQTETEKEYELCQAWRAADGAREAADTAWKQLLLSALGLLGLAYTVYYTKKAADGARKAAEVAERALVELEQPHVFVEVTKPGVIVEALPGVGLRFGQDSYIFYRFVNYGKTPARLLDIIRRFPVVTEPEDMPAPLSDHEKPDRILPVGTVAAFDHPYEEFDNPRAFYGEIFSKDDGPLDTQLFFMGRIRYVDIFDNTYAVGFCFVFDPNWGRFVRVGDERYNYARKECQP